MSIWSSWSQIGWDSFGDEEEPQCGEVRSYATGWSNHYPTTDGDVEQPASVGIASIPGWCVPGHADENTADNPDRFNSLGPWVRLDVVTVEHDYLSGGEPTGKRIGISVVMDENAARTLAADLLTWVGRPKVRPETLR